jgi:acetyltransferase-like isoleucine patch superfamily enzyme
VISGSLIRKIKRGDSFAFRCVRAAVRFVLRPSLPPLPAFMKPPLRALYQLRFGLLVPLRWVLAVCYRQPLFQARCAKVGRGLSVDSLPWVSGPVEIHIGDYVWLGGKISILSPRSAGERPRLVVKDRAEISWNVIISVRKEVIIEENARISFNCRIFDNDGHRRESDLRAQDAPLDPKDVRPVRVCRNAWIGNGSQIMKGVTIGEGAVIGAHSVVISDIPPYCLAIGNPAEVYFRNYGRPAGSR